MMKLQVVPVLVFITLVATIGCSGGGARRTMGRQCPLNYNPVPMDIPSNQKTNLDASLPSGTFDYQGAKLYYVDQASDFRMEISDLKKLNGDFEASITCVRNASPKMQGLALATQGISQMLVDGTSGKVTSEVKSYGFHITETKINIDFVKTNQKPEKPSDVFNGQVAESFLFTSNESDYEIRSHGKTPQGNDFYLTVFFKKK